MLVRFGPSTETVQVISGLFDLISNNTVGGCRIGDRTDLVTGFVGPSTLRRFGAGPLVKGMSSPDDSSSSSSEELEASVYSDSEDDCRSV